MHRLVPDIPFPPYAFIPGKQPHPVSDPAGHSYGQEPAPPDQFDPGCWQDCTLYLYGLDLFNAGYYWECHVQLEAVWVACGRQGLIADFLKALIKLAAAGVKQGEGKPEGVRSHAQRAQELFAAVRSQEKQLLGFSLEDLIHFTTVLVEKGWPLEPPVLWPTISTNEEPPPAAKAGALHTHIMKTGS
jgi:hypothetical protein